MTKLDCQRPLWIVMDQLVFGGVSLDVSNGSATYFFWEFGTFVLIWSWLLYGSISPLGTAFGYGSELSNQRMDALCGIDHMVFTFGSNRSEGFPIVFLPPSSNIFLVHGLIMTLPTWFKQQHTKNDQWLHNDYIMISRTWSKRWLLRLGNLESQQKTPLIYHDLPNGLYRLPFKCLCRVCRLLKSMPSIQIWRVRSSM